ncbi:pentapeptide repeat-containing protein [Rhizobium panacihumi]|uniref:pentapeptide repeat-containing protein n=1 Tax=Rhizobium panacihumi TaxID=2008450 RepID=UPI003D7A4B3F
MVRQSGIFSGLFCIAVIAGGSYFVAPAALGAGSCGSSAAARVDWSGCVKKNLMMSGNDFQGANLSEADFSMTDLRNNNLNGANLQKSRIIRAWFTGSTADKADFSRAEGYRAGLQNISAKAASFESAELQRANFGGSNLSGANFEKAELGRTSFDKADISDVDFTLANLSRADLSKATFTTPPRFDRAFMFLTRIEGLDLSGAMDLAQAQVDLSCGDAATKLPKGLRAPAVWPCPKD